MSTGNKGEVAAVNAKLTMQQLGQSILSGADSFADLGNKIAESGEINFVQIHFKRPRMTVNMGKIDNFALIKNRNLDTFVEKNGSAYTMMFMPEIVKKARSIEESIRHRRKKCSVGSSDYMELKTFTEDFLPFYRKKLSELDELKNELKKAFSAEMPVFVSEVTRLCDAIFIDPEKKGSVLRELGNISGKGGKGLADGLVCELLTDFDAEKMESDELKKFVEEANKARAKKLVTDILEGTLQDCYDSLGSYLSGIDKLEVDDLQVYYSKKDSLKAQASKAKRENIGGIDFIEKLSSKMAALAAENNRLEAIDKGFDLASWILGTADSLDLELALPKRRPEWFTERNIRDNMAYLSA